MQQYGICELCGEHGLVADYGYNKEFICVKCANSDPKLCEHVGQEMIRRHGKEKVQEWTKDAMPGVRH